MDILTSSQAVTAAHNGADFSGYRQRLKRQLDAAWPTAIQLFFRTLPPTQIDAIAAVIGDGQRVRAHLLCAVTGALGGRIEDALARALAIECIQAASLIHDDYVDQDTMRRHRQATWVLEGPRQAVLLGDIIFATALQRMSELSRADGLVVAEVVATMARGAYRELLGPDGGADETTSDAYNNIIYLKTGTLFAAATKLGAIAAGTSTDVHACAFRFGALVGEAYQIADDLSDVVALESDWRAASGKLPFLLPALRYFCRDEAMSLLRNATDTRLPRWFKRESALLKTRMVHEVTRRLGRALSELDAFPDNVHTQWLRRAPHEMMRASCG